MLLAMGLGAADQAPSAAIHIRVGATIQRLLAYSSDSILRFKASSPQGGTFQASEGLNLQSPTAGGTVHVPSKLLLQGPSGNSFQVEVVQAQPGPSTALTNTRLQLPAKLLPGSYTGVMNVVLVYN